MPILEATKFEFSRAFVQSEVVGSPKPKAFTIKSPYFEGLESRPFVTYGGKKCIAS